MAIISNRLNLRPLERDDAGFIAKNLGDYDIAKYLLVPHPYSLNMANEWIEQKLAFQHINEKYYIIEQKNNNPIGAIGFSNRKNKATLSFWLNKQVWNNGFMSEAVNAIISWYFANSKYSEIYSGAFEFNKASLRLQQRLGFSEIGREDLFCPAQNKKLTNIILLLRREIVKSKIK